MTTMVLAQADGRATGLWYTSAAFWSMTGVGIGALAIVIATMSTYRSNNPRRRLYIFESSTVPLLAGSGDRPNRLEIRDEGRVLNDPRLVTVQVICRGRRDIPPDMFAGPITLDLGTEIIAVIESTSVATPSTIPVPRMTTTTTALHIGPALLARDHSLSYSVLVDGNVSVAGQCSLPGVDIRGGRPTQSANNLAELALAVGLAFPVAGFIVSLVLPLGQVIPPVLALEIIGMLAILAGVRLAPKDADVSGDGR